MADKKMTVTKTSMNITLEDPVTKKNITFNSQEEMESWAATDPRRKQIVDSSLMFQSNAFAELENARSALKNTKGTETTLPDGAKATSSNISYSTTKEWDGGPLRALFDRIVAKLREGGELDEYQIKEMANQDGLSKTDAEIVMEKLEGTRFVNNRQQYLVAGKRIYKLIK
jgi:hypothetical protein